jgi:hypothetical protein
MSRMYGWNAALALLCALWAGPVALAWAEAPLADGRRLMAGNFYGCAIEQEGRLGCFGYHESRMGPTPEDRGTVGAAEHAGLEAGAARSAGTDPPRRETREAARPLTRLRTRVARIGGVRPIGGCRPGGARIR